MTTQLDFQLRAGPRAARDARQAVLHEDGCIPGSARPDLLLLLTELVTNAVRHGAADASERVGVRMRVAHDRVRVEVRDSGPGFAPRPKGGAGRDNGGFGLVLVERLAERWGVVREGGATLVWFEYRLREASARSSSSACRAAPGRAPRPADGRPRSGARARAQR